MGLELATLTFLCSQPNEYHYKAVTYPVLDFFFVASAKSPEQAAPLDGAESVLWLDPAKVEENEIAFPSVRDALRVYLELRGQGASRAAS